MKKYGIKIDVFTWIESDPVTMYLYFFFIWVLFEKFQKEVFLICLSTFV